MGKDSEIAWADHTFNPWWGCAKCDPGCENCYAESVSSRFRWDVWGNKPRRLFGDTHWNQPRKWNTAARKAGRKAKIFCGSMCDVFEGHFNKEYNDVVLNAQRQRLWDLIEETPWLTWMLLTKRPHTAWPPWGDDWPENVWLGVSVCESSGLWRVPEMSKLPAKVHFLSAEPMLTELPLWGELGDLNWAIIGGESEQRGIARPFPVDEAISLIDQCDSASIPVFVKQMGTVWAKENGVYQLGDRKGTNIEYWPEALRRQEFPDYI